MTAAKKTTKKTDEAKAATSKVLGSLRMTEKAARLAEGNAYTIMVATTATKNEIKKEFSRIHKVTPVKVAIVQMPARTTFVRGNKGKTKAQKKAVVTLKKGDTISAA